MNYMLTQRLLLLVGPLVFFLSHSHTLIHIQTRALSLSFTHTQTQTQTQTKITDKKPE